MEAGVSGLTNLPPDIVVIIIYGVIVLGCLAILFAFARDSRGAPPKALTPPPPAKKHSHKDRHRTPIYSEFEAIIDEPRLPAKTGSPAKLERSVPDPGLKKTKSPRHR